MEGAGPFQSVHPSIPSCVLPPLLLSSSFLLFCLSCSSHLPLVLSRQMYFWLSCCVRKYLCTHTYTHTPPEARGCRKMQKNETMRFHTQTILHVQDGNFDHSSCISGSRGTNIVYTRGTYCSDPTILKRGSFFCSFLFPSLSRD